MYAFHQGTCQAPNLVPNGSFEERVDCIWNDSSVEDAPPWFNPTAASPDVFHECAVVIEDTCPWPGTLILDPWAFGTPTNALGCEAPYDGVGYAGFFVYGPDTYGFDGYKEYLGVRLTEPLEAGSDYTVKFDVSLAERTGYAIRNIQVYFSPDSLTPMDTLPMVYNSYIDVDPQLSGNTGEFIANYDGWHEMAWDYTADGGEQFMYIGSFEREDEMDTLYVMQVDPEDNYSQYSYYYLDDVQIRKDSSNDLHDFSGIHFSIYPNPTSDNISIEASTPMGNIWVYDLQGRRILDLENINKPTVVLDIAEFSLGLYFLEIELISGQRLSTKIIKR